VRTSEKPDKAMKPTTLLSALAVSSMLLAACSSGSDDASECGNATVTVDFAGDTSLEPGPRDEVLEMIEKYRSACPIAYITVYEDAAGAETAQMRDNHISNLLSFRAELGSESKVRVIEAAPSDDLAGRAIIELRAE